MKGNEKVINALNDLLTGELTSADLYLLHSRMYDDMGYTKLFERISHEMTDEIDHSSQLINRVLFLEGTPIVGPRDKFELKTDVKSMMEQSLEAEYVVANDLKKVIKLCEAESDYVSREMLQVLLSDTENDHIFWLETQLKLINSIGLENYLQSVA